MFCDRPHEEESASTIIDHIDSFGKDGYMVYETLASYNGNIDYIDEEDVKKYTNVKKLDSMSTVFIGSLSVIGLYMVYKIIKKTL